MVFVFGLFGRVMLLLNRCVGLFGVLRGLESGTSSRLGQI